MPLRNSQSRLYRDTILCLLNTPCITLLSDNLGKNQDICKYIREMAFVCLEYITTDLKCILISFLCFTLSLSPQTSSRKCWKDKNHYFLCGHSYGKKPDLIFFFNVLDKHHLPSLITSAVTDYISNKTFKNNFPNQINWTFF